MARALGVRSSRLFTVVFMVGAWLAGLGGALSVPVRTVSPGMGELIIIEAFVVVVLGGLGSNFGAFWGGLLIGIVQQMSTLVLPYQLQNTAIFVVFLLIIFLRPQGMFGRLSERA